MNASFLGVFLIQLSWGIALFALLLGVIYLLYYAKIKKRPPVSKQQYQLLQVQQGLLQQRLTEAKLELKRLQSTCEQFRAEMNTKNQQMASQALHVLQKNQVLSQINQLLSSANQQKGAEATKRVLKKLSNLIDYGIKLDKDWEHFQQVFEQLHPQFYQNLKVQFPMLTRQDLRLCALLKLNLSNKEMATLLNISPNSVNMKRYRLRKKMDCCLDSSLLTASA